MATDPEGLTRDWWLANNREIMEQEHEPPEAIFRNQIETRLRLHEDIRDESDEKLGAAYIACLAQYEAEGDAKAMNEPWAPLTTEHLVDHEGVTQAEAEVIVQMAKAEYE